MAARSALVACVLVASAAHAAHADRALHAGFELRTDLRTHPIRVPIGYRATPLDVSLVLDPLVFADGVHDADLVVEHALDTTRFALLAGWRTTTVDLAGGHQWYQTPLVGMTARLGRHAWFEARFGAELSVLVVKHGGELPTSWIGLDRAIVDRLHAGMFVRLEYVHDL